MKVSQALTERKSVRAFLDKPVAIHDIETILDYARCAPSGTNTQPWQVAVVSGKSKESLDAKLVEAFRTGKAKEMDYKYYPDQTTLAMKQRRIACGLQMYQTLGIERSNNKARIEQWGKNYSGFGAPVVLYILAPKVIQSGSFMDCGMFIQSVMLMATELGLATCPQAALAEYPTIVKQQLGYADDTYLLCGIALGYEDTTEVINNYRTPREEVTTFTKFFD